MRVTTSHCEISDKNHIFSFSQSKRNPPENNLQARGKNHWNKQHFGTR